MFTQPAPAPSPAGLATPVVVSSSPPSGIAASPASRTSRLRGLSYLRSYTQSHLLSGREHSNPAAATTPTSASPSAAARPTVSLTRSISTPESPPRRTPTTAAPLFRAAAEPSRYALISSHASHPLASSGSSAADDEAPATLHTTTSSTPQPGPSVDLSSAPTEQSNHGARTTMTRARSATVGDGLATASSANNTTGAAGNLDILPSIRFSTFYDPRASRPSLAFSPVARTLPTGNEIVRVGRYSERDNQPSSAPGNAPSAAPVGFKSKVVSRRHCEFWYEGGKWYIRDVKSSSGTFLNHIRLSPPGQESKPFPVNDGDIVQLGIDFKGGEEMIFRCVKMRLELNRGWQNKLNTFNMNTHKRLRNILKPNDSSASQTYSQDCSICLNSIAPCQCLFVAPCSHTWHYKCIRSLLQSPSYPIFICPNCRAAADLEAEVEDPEEWEQLDSEPDGGEAHNEGDEEPSNPPAQQSLAAPAPAEACPQVSAERPRTRQSSRQVDVDPVDVTMIDAPAPAVETDSGSNTDAPPPPQAARPVFHATSHPVPIPSIAAVATSSASSDNNSERGTRTPSPNGVPVHLLNSAEGPITPRNDAGPWVFDGSGLRVLSGGGGGGGGGEHGQMESLDGVAES